MNVNQGQLLAIHGVLAQAISPEEMGSMKRLTLASKLLKLGMRVTNPAREHDNNVLERTKSRWGQLNLLTPVSGVRDWRDIVPAKFMSGPELDAECDRIVERLM